MSTGELDNNPHCPFCNTLLKGFVGIGNDSTPTPGDPTVCIVCTEWLEFDDDMNLIPIESKTLEYDGVLIGLQKATSILRALDNP